MKDRCIGYLYVAGSVPWREGLTRPGLTGTSSRLILQSPVFVLIHISTGRTAALWSAPEHYA